jgi:CBS domain containing-hemolysin-like protein
VGDIYDERDEEDDSFKAVSAGKWDVSAELSVSDFLEKADLDEGLINADANSMGGWITELLERFPENGETVEAPPLTVKVKMENDQRIDRLQIEIKDKR